MDFEAGHKLSACSFAMKSGLGCRTSRNLEKCNVYFFFYPYLITERQVKILRFVMPC